MIYTYIFGYTFNRILAGFWGIIGNLLGLSIFEKFKQFKYFTYFMQILQKYKTFHTSANKIYFFHVCMQIYPFIWTIAVYNNTLYFYTVLIAFSLSIVIVVHISFINTNFAKKHPFIWKLLVGILILAIVWSTCQLIGLCTYELYKYIYDRVKTGRYPFPSTGNSSDGEPGGGPSGEPSTGRHGETEDEDEVENTREMSEWDDTWDKERKAWDEENYKFLRKIILRRNKKIEENIHYGRMGEEDKKRRCDWLEKNPEKSEKYNDWLQKKMEKANENSRVYHSKNGEEVNRKERERKKKKRLENKS